MEYVKNPHEIEEKSFEIITKELGDQVFPEREGKIIKRVIHTTADFQFADLIKIHPEAIDAAMAAIRQGCRIYTDTHMALSGINKRKLAQYGAQAYCLVDDPQVAQIAKAEQVTRSIVGVRQAAADPETKIFVFGNAPTALFTLCQLMDQDLVKPSLVVGVPVGFVGAAESKEELVKRPVPSIAVAGRKGGSTVAAAIVNAILYMMEPPHEA